jgi:hypothetical protein
MFRHLLELFRSATPKPSGRGNVRLRIDALEDRMSPSIVPLVTSPVGGAASYTTVTYTTMGSLSSSSIGVHPGSPGPPPPPFHG